VNQTIKIAFKVFVFHRKRGEGSSRFRRSVWRTLRKEAAARTVRSFAAVLPPMSIGAMGYAAARRFVQDIIPPVVLQLLLSAGRLRWNSHLTSIYLAAGSNSRPFGLPSLENLYIAVKGRDKSEFESPLQAYLLNATYYTRILGISLSDRFNALGRKVILSRKPEEVDQNAPRSR